MPRRNEITAISMVDLVGQAIAEADSAVFQNDPIRYRRLAMAAIGKIANPTEEMIDAAHEAASFDDHWAINSRRDFRKAVRAMVAEAQGKRTPKG